MINQIEFGIKVGRLQFETFLPEMREENAHDHMCDFWLYSLTPYVELVYNPMKNKMSYEIVPKHKWIKRPAKYAHLVLGPLNGQDQRDGYDYPTWEDGPVYQFVWRCKNTRTWGYWIRNIWLPYDRYTGNQRVYTDA